uniref:Uncharacterized protein n=1 Tax=Myotis myotis TaxID=51298 RepID=A0A7J7RCU6_MYOMY|nr:hypothetical protein mMyoMyo1_010817 [Myotis myotis]
MTPSPWVPTDWSPAWLLASTAQCRGARPTCPGSELCGNGGLAFVPQWAALPFPCIGRHGQTWSPEFSLPPLVPVREGGGASSFMPATGEQEGEKWRHIGWFLPGCCLWSGGLRAMLHGDLRTFAGHL